MWACCCCRAYALITAEPRTFGEELCAALLCQPPAAAAVPPAAAPFTPPGFTSPQGLASPAGTQSPKSTGGAGAGSNTAGGLATGPGQLDLQLQAGRAARVLGFLLHHNPAGQHRLLALQVSEAQGDMLLGRCVRLLSECARRSGDGAARQVCCSILRMLVEWCAGCEPAVAALLAPASHLPLLVDLVAGRVPGGDAHTAGEHKRLHSATDKIPPKKCTLVAHSVLDVSRRLRRCWRHLAICRCWWIWWERECRVAMHTPQVNTRLHSATVQAVKNASLQHDLFFM
jgi:hypothetical protein